MLINFAECRHAALSIRLSLSQLARQLLPPVRSYQSPRRLLRRPSQSYLELSISTPELNCPMVLALCSRNGRKLRTNFGGEKVASLNLTDCVHEQTEAAGERDKSSYDRSHWNDKKTATARNVVAELKCGQIQCRQIYTFCACVTKSQKLILKNRRWRLQVFPFPDRRMAKRSNPSQTTRVHNAMVLIFVYEALA